MDVLAQRFFDFFGFFFNILHNPISTNNVFLQRLATFVISDPLILSVVAMFFVGFLVSIFIRIYHSS